MSYEVRVILRLLRLILLSSKPIKQLLTKLINAIECNEHMINTKAVEKRLLEAPEKRTPPMSLEERRARRDTLQLKIVE